MTDDDATLDAVAPPERAVEVIGGLVEIGRAHV